MCGDYIIFITMCSLVCSHQNTDMEKIDVRIESQFLIFVDKSIIGNSITKKFVSTKYRPFIFVVPIMLQILISV